MRIRTLETTSTVYLEWYQDKNYLSLELVIGERHILIATAANLYNGDWRLSANPEAVNYHHDRDYADRDEAMAVAEAEALRYYGLDAKATGKDALSIHMAGRKA